MPRVAERIGGFMEGRLSGVRFSAAGKRAAGDRYDPKAAMPSDDATKWEPGEAFGH
jgi:hypothetical protein